MPAPQPPVVRAATALIVVSAVLTVIKAVSTLRNIGSMETVAALNKALSMGWAKSSHLSVTTLQDLLRVSANISAVLAAAVAVLAIFASRGSRQSRIALAVLALPILIVCLMASGFAGLGMLVGIGLLWSRNAAPWFAGEAAVAPRVSSPPTVPARTSPPGYSYPAPLPPPPAAMSATQPPRPSRVTYSAVVAIVLSSLAAIGGLLSGIGLVALLAQPDLRQSVVDRTQALQMSVSLSDLNRELPFAAIAAAVIVILGLAGVLAGVLVLRGSPQARIALIVLSAISAVISVLMITSVISIIWLAGAVSVLLGLGASDSAEWFKQR
ncbi:hypothetical protein Back2_15560 [Nocardioides baekrokdamisoli]|uniref:DUF4064 domain-containing protein n=1 Tax=Nocardioides baekrokdamisoli TaxID=1804624 RepID=A0A3G9J2P3_9ACTN|nr:hypothetical protein [Nocardioides baekrokdamisoli]BBH17269.1 hypothetical protein Back2_15560 [Nocardioides baekrokdamisoli]